jgi:hypothetical protein
MYACADRFCVSGVLVAHEGAVCPECAPVYARDTAEEDALCVMVKRQGTDAQGYFA